MDETSGLISFLSKIICKLISFLLEHGISFMLSVKSYIRKNIIRMNYKKNLFSFLMTFLHLNKSPYLLRLFGILFKHNLKF